MGATLRAVGTAFRKNIDRWDGGDVIRCGSRPGLSYGREVREVEVGPIRASGCRRHVLGVGNAIEFPVELIVSGVLCDTEMNRLSLGGEVA